MDLKNTYLTSVVPLWCQDLNDAHLRTVWKRENSFYAIDIESSYPTKRNLFKTANHIFRVKYASSRGGIFYFLMVISDVPYTNPQTFRQEWVPGVQILGCVTIKNGNLTDYDWEDTHCRFQSVDDPMYKLAEAAKRYEKKQPPFYIKFINLN